MGFKLDIVAYKKLFGLRFKEMVDELAPQADEQTRKKIKNQKAIYYKQNLDKVQPNHGLLALLKSSRGKYKTALVTTASRDNVDNLLDYYKIDEQLFDCIVTAEGVSKSKPDPEAYKLAIKTLGAKASECCVFEDTDMGIQAAEAAGAKFVRVRLWNWDYFLFYYL